MGKTASSILVGGLALGLAVLAAWHWWPRRDEQGPQPDGQEADPRLTFETPFRNVRPDVKYVGSAACAKCHAAIAETYGRHPMGRSLMPITAVAGQQNYAAETQNPFEAVGFQFSVEWRRGQVVHKERSLGPDGRPVTETAAEIQYAIGSGTHAYSYLIERDGLLFQSPVTWYAQAGKWGLSPGFQERRDRFERPVLAGCLFCHCNHAEPVAHTLNRFQPPIFRDHTIGCERCHGPGELHVRVREDGESVRDVDTSIVNPRRLRPALREAVCEQCHLGGHVRSPRRGREVFDYRPGLPFDLFWRIFVKPGRSAEEIKVAGHVEQMHSSQCFRASEGKLGCTSCHDPHSLPRPEQKETYYRARCLSCHESKGCSVPAELRRQTSAADSCTACHMPNANTDINHVALTDHRIPRDPGNPRAPTAEGAPSNAPLAPFHGGTVDLRDAEMARDLGVALMELARQRPDPSRTPVSRLVSPWLESAIRAHPEDVEAREALGLAYALQNRVEEALGVCEESLRLAPEREVVLGDAAMMARALGQNEVSLRHWQAALEVNPRSSRYRYEVARLLAERQEWDKAVPECRRVLEHNAAHVGSRMLLVEYCLHEGKKELAREEFDTVLALKPPNVDELKRWFAARTAP